MTYMTKEELIIHLLVSLNKGNCGTIADRPYYAIEQYERLVKKGIIEEQIHTPEDRELSRLETDALITSRFRPPARPL